jgi:hypothetical protein
MFTLTLFKSGTKQVINANDIDIASKRFEEQIKDSSVLKIIVKEHSFGKKPIIARKWERSDCYV